MPGSIVLMKPNSSGKTLFPRWILRGVTGISHIVKLLRPVTHPSGMERRLHDWPNTAGNQQLTGRREATVAIAQRLR
jgi:hypothetical protein